MSARLQDGTFKNLQVGSKAVIDENGNGTFNTLVVKGGSNSIWTTAFLPDNDQLTWAPARNTWYFQSNLTTNRTLTLSQASLNAAYPSATNGAMVFCGNSMFLLQPLGTINCPFWFVLVFGG